MDSTKTLKILNLETDIQFKPPQNLLDLLNANDISINQSCGGNGTCTTCRVRVLDLSSVTPRAEIEIERSEERDFTPEERLSCQTTLLNSVSILIESFEDGII